MIKNFKYYFFVLFGAFLFALFIWIRFIRERLPKDIPLTLNTLGFLILLEICCIYLYIIISIIKQKKTDPIITNIINTLYYPLEEFDNFSKNLPIIETYYKKFIIWYAKSLEYFVIETNAFFVLLSIIPRLVLVGVLCIDVFYFNYLSSIYKVLLLSLLLFIRRYSIYSIKTFRNISYTSLKEDVSDICTPYVQGVHPAEWPENNKINNENDDDEDDEMALPTNIFVEYYIKEYIYNYKIINYTFIVHNKEFYDRQFNKYNIEKISNNDRLPSYIRNKYQNETETTLKNVLYLSILLEHYEITSNKTSYRYIFILVYTLYLLCWIYILIKSTSWENIQNTLKILYEIMLKVEEPFSGLFI
jgi:hypothetical protein